MLPKINRLNSPLLIDITLKKGRKINRFLFTLCCFQEEGVALPRFTFFVPKRLIKKAVNRNRLKRALSEAVRLSLPRIKPGACGVFIARRDFAGLKLSGIKKEVEEALNEADAVKKQTEKK